MVAMAIAVSSPSGVGSWVSFLRAHSAITRQLNADLLNVHGLTLNDYEVLLLLSKAEGHRMRRVDLAQTVVLTASGITRLLDGLERAGYVEKDTCASDARVSYAKLTGTGHSKLRAAAETHLRGIEDLFIGRYSDEELELLAGLLGRLPQRGKECGEGKDACEAGVAGACGVDENACSA
jgi:DNA-binding MarR family transcriptional regulator